jgi:transcriptional regulator with XRE-family HTH domain
MDIARVLRSERDRAALTQSQLARRAGVSQATVSAVERGFRRPSHDLTAQLLGALGLQARFDTEPVELPLADLDAAIDAALTVPTAERLSGAGLDGAAVLRQLAPADVVVDGVAAAVLHGVPMTVSVLDVVVEHRRVAALADIIRRRYLERWSDVWRNWGAQGADPRTPGPMRWCTPDGEFRLRIVDERPDTVTIFCGDLAVPVRVLHDIELENPRVRQALSRVRERHGPRRTPDA